MKNGIKYLVAGLAATGLAVSSYANITVGWSTAKNSYITDNTGAAGYLSGDLVEVGSFASAPTVGSPSLAGFTVYGTTLTGTGGNVGIFSGSVNAPDAGFAHNQIYLVAFNNATGTVTPGVTQLGIFVVNDSTVPSWKFPATADIPNSTAIDLQDLFTGNSGALVSAATVVYGSTGTDGGTYSLAELKVVPEPSTWMLVGTGLLGLLGLRRRS